MLPLLFGLIAGAILGAAIGVGAGLAWVKLTKTSSFEGYSGMLVFYSFMPVGAIFGATLGVVTASSLH
jgi:hypothetical protein